MVVRPCLEICAMLHLEQSRCSVTDLGETARTSLHHEGVYEQDPRMRSPHLAPLVMRGRREGDARRIDCLLFCPYHTNAACIIIPPQPSRPPLSSISQSFVTGLSATTRTKGFPRLCWDGSHRRMSASYSNQSNLVISRGRNYLLAFHSPPSIPPYSKPTRPLLKPFIISVASIHCHL